MLDFSSLTDVQRFHAAKKRSREVLDLFDSIRTNLIRDYSGPLYSPFSANVRRYVNKLQVTATITQQVLCFQQPQCRVTSFESDLQAACKQYEVNINRVAANINLRATLQECVLDAFFMLGMAKVRMAEDGLKEIEPNMWLDVGKPWVDRVSFSDMILDMPVKNRRSMRFYGDRYRASWQGVQNRRGGDYEAAVVDKMGPTSRSNQNSESERADQIALGNAVDDDELEPMVWLLDVFFPREKKFVTFSADNDALLPLKVDDWDGSKTGPYKILAFGDVPDNVMPATPAEALSPLDRLMNRLYGKLANQARRQAFVTIAPAGQEEDERKLKDAVDGESITFKQGNAKDIATISKGGIDGNTHAFFLAAAEVYNTQSGNERALGGLSTEADTATQEEMLARGAGGRIAFMGQEVYTFTSEILREIGCLMFHDEALTVPSSMEVENTGYHVDTTWKPGAMKAATRNVVEKPGEEKPNDQTLFDYYDFAVVPNSMKCQPPEAKLAILKQFAADFLQMMPAIQAGIFDGDEFTRIYAEYTNTPEILRLSKQMQAGMQGAGDPHQATKPANTSREVVRRSVNGGPKGSGMGAVLGQMMQMKPSGNQAAVAQ